VDTGAMADEIRSMAGRDFSDPQDVHDTVSGVHEIVAALQEALNDWRAPGLPDRDPGGRQPDERDRR